MKSRMSLVAILKLFGGLISKYQRLLINHVLNTSRSCGNLYHQRGLVYLVGLVTRQNCGNGRQSEKQS